LTDEGPIHGQGSSDAERLVDDERLFEELREASRRQPLPPAVIAAAKAAWSWRTIDAELARITHDSFSDEGQAVLVRSGGRSRLLSFGAPDMTVDLEVVDAGRTRRLVGQLAPAEAATIEVRRPDRTVQVETDDRGRFAVGDLAPGPVSLVCRFTAGPPAGAIATDWILI
jgi:hypothetical protein